MTTKWLQQVMPKSMYNQLKGMIVFRPEDPINLWQATPQMQTGSKVEHIKGYRYPAPGSVHRAAVPVRDSEDTVYDIKNYSRNPDNLALDMETMIAGTQPVLSNPPSEFGDRNGADGRFANPAVAKYDPSGLRSSMSATWPAMDAALEETGRGKHMPMADYQERQAALDAESEKKGIPHTTGRFYKPFSARPKNYNDVRW